MTDIQRQRKEAFEQRRNRKEAIHQRQRAIDTSGPMGRDFLTLVGSIARAGRQNRRPGISRIRA